MKNYEARKLSTLARHFAKDHKLKGTSKRTLESFAKSVQILIVANHPKIQAWAWMNY